MKRFASDLRASCSSRLLAAPLGRARLRKTENVVVIVTDGLRWQEVFRGAETALRHREAGRRRGRRCDEGRLLAATAARSAAKRCFPSSGRSSRRRAQIYGNADAGSSAQVANGFKFSYPGYNEIITGAGDPRIDSNEYGPNPERVGLRVDERAARNSTAASPWSRAGTPSPDLQPRPQPPRHAGRLGDAGSRPPRTRGRSCSTRSTRTITHEFSDMPWDALLQQTLLDYVAREEAAPALRRLRRDRRVGAQRPLRPRRCSRRTPWTASSGSSGRRCRRCPQYQDKTTFIITTDHGRGDGPENWKHHDWNVDGAENMWIARHRARTRPRWASAGTRPSVTQSQIAATVAAPARQGLARRQPEGRAADRGRDRRKAVGELGPRPECRRDSRALATAGRPPAPAAS